MRKKMKLILISLSIFISNCIPSNSQETGNSSILLKLSPQFCQLDNERIISSHCDISKRYREVDGSCNNIFNPGLGQSVTPYKRYMKSYYEDNIQEPKKKSQNFFFSAKPLPNARSVSLAVHDSCDTPSNINHLGVIFGQFIAHDITFIQLSTGPDNQRISCQCNENNAECVNIMTPREDTIDADQVCQALPRAGASKLKFDCARNSREQTNRATHFLDLSQLYGHDLEQQNKIRSTSDGLLKVSSAPGMTREYLPTLEAGSCSDESSNMLCFESGDSRSSQNMMLTSIHTIWMREHNRIARILKQINPKWSNEILFQEAKRLLMALYQNIIYSEWLPIIIGRKYMRDNELNLEDSGYFFGYDTNVNPSISLEFSTAAFRFGHSMIRSYMTKGTHSLNQFANLTLRSIMRRPVEAYQHGGLDSIFRGLLLDHATKMDNHVTDEILNHLFETDDKEAETKRFSLPAVNIMRGRDTGLASYNEFRKYAGLDKVLFFFSLKEIPSAVRAKLGEVYRSVNDIDAFTGGISEAPMDDATVGPTFAYFIAKQFKELKFGDRFYFENGHNSFIRFTMAQLDEIRKVTMSSIVCNNLDIVAIQRNSFFPIDSLRNPLVDCSTVPQINFNHWREI